MTRNRETKKTAGPTLLMVGPFPPPPMGPAVRNGLLADALQARGTRIIRVNTVNNRAKVFWELCTHLSRTRQLSVYLSVSRNGQLILFPVLYILARMFSNTGRFIFYPAAGSFYENVQSIAGPPRRIYISFLRHIHHVFVQTDGMRTKLLGILPACSVSRLPNPKPYRCETVTEFGPDVPMRDRRLLYLSRVRAAKGIEVLLEAMDHVRSALGVDVPLDIYGVLTDDYRDRFNSLVSRRPNVAYRGVLPANEQLVRTINSYYAMVFPTLCTGEGFPGVLADAALAGLPMIASDIAYNSEMVRDGDNGLLFTPGASEELAEKILMLLKDPELRNRMAARSLEGSAEYYMDTVVSRLEEKLKE